jgi:hypothetical protein
MITGQANNGSIGAIFLRRPHFRNIMLAFNGRWPADGAGAFEKVIS